MDDFKKSDQEPDVVWYKECKPKMWRSIIIQKGNALLIQEVQEEDGGNYTCELKYEGKLIRRTTELKVTGTRFLAGRMVTYENLKDPQTPLTFKGVVFNETKGAFTVLLRKIKTTPVRNQTTLGEVGELGFILCRWTQTSSHSKSWAPAWSTKLLECSISKSNPEATPN
ncbi:hypothetical protein PANDA_018243 [Ailuropoda melanoleuca]|uniref:Ig-like domain-containing protein n=1 Tax=Ailuropoda melanoleuca TaxID=9646 RepID=D2HZJ6_AILME|nr:hypothetical protein PANDA_018243 [Ailuropoda melanoleuca]